MKPSELNEFTRAYVVAALWTSEPEDLVTSGDFEPKGQALVGSVPDYWMKQAIADCDKFQAENETLLEQAGTDSRNGHDFWLTRNGHGAGFWDRGYPDEVGDALTEAAHAFGEAYLDWEELELEHDDETSEA
jgi:hypothetical protein